MSDDKPTIGILKKHKNGFLVEIEKSTLNKRDFYKEEVASESGTSFVIRYRNTPFHFTVYPDNESFNHFYYCFTLIAPGFRDSDMMPDAFSGNSIGNAYEAFATWLDDHLKPYLEDLSTPDLWAQIQSQAPIVSDAPLIDDDREPFTEDERAQLRMVIKEFRQLVLDKFETSEEHQSLIDARLDYLAESLDRLNRFDWRSVAVNTLITISLQLKLDEEQGRWLLQLFQKLFSTVVYLLQQTT